MLKSDPGIRRAAVEPIVDVIVGGVQKAGTTSLAHYLTEHPGLLSPTRKETHFFDNESIDWDCPDYSSFHAFFPAYDGTRRAFEATPAYIFWPPALERIRVYNPGARLIFLFRDPIERAWSQWCMQYAQGRERFAFHVAIRQGRLRLRGIAESDRARRQYCHYRYGYVERGFYARQVCLLLEIFPKSQVLFLRSRDLKENHAAVLDSIASFLGLDRFPKLAARLANRRPQRNYPSRLLPEDVRYLRRLFEEEVREFAQITGLRVDDWPTIDPGLDVT